MPLQPSRHRIMPQENALGLTIISKDAYVYGIDVCMSIHKSIYKLVSYMFNNLCMLSVLYQGEAREHSLLVLIPGLSHIP